MSDIHKVQLFHKTAYGAQDQYLDGFFKNINHMRDTIKVDDTRKPIQCVQKAMSTHLIYMWPDGMFADKRYGITDLKITNIRDIQMHKRVDLYIGGQKFESIFKLDDNNTMQFRIVSHGRIFPGLLWHDTVKVETSCPIDIEYTLIPIVMENGVDFVYVSEQQYQTNTKQTEAVVHFNHPVTRLDVYTGLPVNDVKLSLYKTPYEPLQLTKITNTHHRITFQELDEKDNLSSNDTTINFSKIDYPTVILSDDPGNELIFYALNVNSVRCMSEMCGLSFSK
jgi:hypothetical protein